jgi:hypothetical protein
MRKKLKKYKPKVVDVQLESVYDFDYPNEPIGGGNPYYCCKYCKVSDPQINGKLENHRTWCEYRIIKELQK